MRGGSASALRKETLRRSDGFSRGLCAEKIPGLKPPIPSPILPPGLSPAPPAEAGAPTEWQLQRQRQEQLQMRRRNQLQRQNQKQRQIQKRGRDARATMTQILLLLLLGLMREVGERGRIGGIAGGFGELLVAFFVERGADANVHGEALAGESFIYAADGSDVAVVASIGDADVAKADGISERGIEGEPA